MTVATPHRFSRMANEVINDPLVDAGTGKVAYETVPQAVPAFDFLPFAAFECVLKMTIGLVWGQRRGVVATAFPHSPTMAERMRPAWMVMIDPTCHDRVDRRGELDAASCVLPSDSFAFTDRRNTKVKIKIASV